ncbi:MAG: flavin reductase family protein [Ktedonobacterales bacterium]
MDEAAKKEALRLFTYGLYAITCGDAGEQGELNAFTANWLAQVSFDPPLVALSVENNSVSLPLIHRTGRFAVNVFAADQRDLAGQLGKSFAKHPDKLAGLSFGQSETGCPVLLDLLAWVECAVVSELPVGDSTLVVGRVVGANVLRRAEPLTMLAAGFKHAG